MIFVFVKVNTISIYFFNVFFTVIFNLFIHIESRDVIHMLFIVYIYIYIEGIKDKQLNKVNIYLSSQ
jgi:hypothetical protein